MKDPNRANIKTGLGFRASGFGGVELTALGF